MAGPAPYPLFLDLHDRLCIVVGGGPVGARKVEALVESGARVVVVSPETVDTLKEAAKDGRIDWRSRPFEPADLDGALLAFAATSDGEVNRAVVESARARGVMVNDARAEDGDFAVPATLRRGKLQIAVSTGGGSPAYARLIRERLDRTFGPEHAAFVELLEGARARVKARFPHDAGRRRRIWNRLVSWETLELVREGRTEEVEALITECLS